MASARNIAENIIQIQQNIAEYARKYHRSPETIQLLAVSKTKAATQITLAYEAGQKDFGESYLQEALEKINQLQSLAINWHFIGAIQSNKTRDIAQYFDWVHSVDRLKVARRLSEQRPTDKPPLNICLQVNISQEESKAGLSLDDLTDTALAIQALPNIRLRGLMAIPARAETLEQQRQVFCQLRMALESLNQQGLKLDTLSMGMSNDMEAAIAEGATIVRIGTAIFGSRNPKTQ